MLRSPVSASRFHTLWSHACLAFSPAACLVKNPPADDVCLSLDSVGGSLEHCTAGPLNTSSKPLECPCCFWGALADDRAGIIGLPPDDAIGHGGQEEEGCR